MYTYIFGALAIMGVIMVAGGVMFATSTALGSMHLDRLNQRRKLVVAQAEIKQVEIETSMRLHQLELRRTALLEGTAQPELPEPKEEVVRPVKVDVIRHVDEVPMYFCSVCGDKATPMSLGLHCGKTVRDKRCMGTIIKVHA